MYRISRYWNRLVYLIIWIGRKMIWDYVGINSDLLKSDEFCSKYTKDILTTYYKDVNRR